MKIDLKSKIFFHLYNNLIGMSFSAAFMLGYLTALLVLFCVNGNTFNLQLNTIHFSACSASGVECMLHSCHVIES